MNVWNGCCVGPGQTARTFVLLGVQLNLKKALLISPRVVFSNAVRIVIMVSYAIAALCVILLMRHFAFRIHYNGDNGSVLIFIGWMHGTDVVLGSM